MSKIIFPLSKDYSSENSLEPKEAQAQSCFSPQDQAALEQMLLSLGKIMYHYDTTHNDPCADKKAQLGNAYTALKAALGK